MTNPVMPVNISRRFFLTSQSLAMTTVRNLVDNHSWSEVVRLAKVNVYSGRATIHKWGVDLKIYWEQETGAPYYYADIAIKVHSNQDELEEITDLISHCDSMSGNSFIAFMDMFTDGLDKIHQEEEEEDEEEDDGVMSQEEIERRVNRAMSKYRPGSPRLQGFDVGDG